MDSAPRISHEVRDQILKLEHWALIATTGACAKGVNQTCLNELAQPWKGNKNLYWLAKPPRHFGQWPGNPQLGHLDSIPRWPTESVSKQHYRATCINQNTILTKDMVTSAWRTVFFLHVAQFVLQCQKPQKRESFVWVEALKWDLDLHRSKDNPIGDLFWDILVKVRVKKLFWDVQV